MRYGSLKEIPVAALAELCAELDGRGPRYTSYPVAPVWQSNFPPEPFVAALEALAAREAAVALYLHLPFCAQRCLYCGCNSFITHDAERMARYATALAAEVDRVADRLGGRVAHQQLHLGGGTPTHLPAAELARVLDRVLARFPAAPACERSVEVDPRVTTEGHLEVLCARGFRRISVGVQDLHPAVQNAVNRHLGRDELERFVAMVRAHGFDSLNIDLMYGLPMQTRARWRETLAAVAALGPDRLACFGYAHLPERLKHQRALPTAALPTVRQRLGMILEAHAVLTEAGYQAIGMDHFALPDDDLARAAGEGRLWRNFMGYTASRGLPMIGMGCSAISEIDDVFAQNITPPEPYAAAIAQGGWAITRGLVLDADDLARKHLINHLMCNLEIDLGEVARFDDETAARAQIELGAFAARGLLEPTSAGFRVTPLGQPFLRNFAMPFDKYLSQQSTTFSQTI